MGSWRIESLFRSIATAVGVFVVAVLGAAALAPAAKAGSLEEVGAQVQEATAPVRDVVESVVPPPPSAPAAGKPALPPPEATAPPVKLPTPAAKPAAPSSPKPAPAPHADSPAAEPSGDSPSGVVGSVAETVTKVGSMVTTPTTPTIDETESGVGGEVAAIAGSSGDEASGSIRKEQDSRPTTTAGAAAGSGAGAADARKGEDSPARQGGSETLALLPARLLHPFLRIWPAVALVADQPGGDSIDGFSRSALALLAAEALGAPATAPVAADSPDSPDPTGAAPDPEAGSPISFAPPFIWHRHDNALAALLLFAFIGVAGLAILALMRREVGVPLLPRRIARWRH